MESARNANNGKFMMLAFNLVSVNAEFDKLIHLPNTNAFAQQGFILSMDNVESA